MSASQQCRARGSARARILPALAFLAAVSVTRADEESAPGTQPGCDSSAVVDHVLGQMQVYGPKSFDNEYFAFIYRLGGELESAVARGNVCNGPNGCTVNTAFAAKRIPKGAKVLGEWHTHPHQNGSSTLSKQDVRGAFNNVHIRCYTAYYAGPDGEIYTWDPRSTSVPTAMYSRKVLGRYALRGGRDPVAIIAAHQDPGSKCLSTNTNVQTADTRTRYCKKSATSR